MSDAVTILGLHGSMATRTAIAAAEEAGVKWNLQEVNILTGAHKEAAYLDKFSPFGHVPALVDGDYTLFESRPISKYLLTRSGASELYPNDAKTRGLIDAWVSVEQSEFSFIGEALAEFYFGPLFHKKDAEEAHRTTLVEKIDTAFGVLDKHLAKSKFLVGDHFTLADLVFLPYTFYLLQSPGLEHSLDKHTHVKAWWDIISARPAWKVATSHGFGF